MERRGRTKTDLRQATSTRDYRQRNFQNQNLTNLGTELFGKRKAGGIEYSLPWERGHD